MEMPQLYFANLTLEEIILLQEILAKKKKQEELRREHQQRQILHDVKDIFVGAFDIQNFYGKAPIISQLVNIVDQINVEDIESNEKFMDWSTNKFENKVVDRFSTKIAEQNVQLQECVHNIEELIEKVKHLYKMLCDMPRFTSDLRENIQQIQADMKIA